MEFLSLIRPEYSLISCGKDNFYGHPHKELLDRLHKMESNILITYETGAITVGTDGRRMKITGYR
jgi:competence protein ComEC